MKKTITTAAIAAMLLSAGVALADAPVCGDVNNDSSVKTSDALLVLKKSVDQPVTLDCSAYDDQFSACQSDLSGCQNAPVCGNSILEGAEDCEAGNLDDKTCVTQGFAGGTLVCASGCMFDTSGCYATRFDSSGATIIDHQTGLEWEKKDSAGGGYSDCPGGPTCANAHDVDNFYQWSSTGTAPDGGAYTDFLGRLNGGASSSPSGPTTGCYAGHCDWRLPTIEELRSIVDLSASDCGSGSSCMDPVFGPTQSYDYWSSTTYQNDLSDAWDVYFYVGNTVANLKTNLLFVRAVRSGS